MVDVAHILDVTALEVKKPELGSARAAKPYSAWDHKGALSSAEVPRAGLAGGHAASLHLLIGVF